MGVGCTFSQSFEMQRVPQLRLSAKPGRDPEVELVLVQLLRTRALLMGLGARRVLRSTRLRGGFVENRVQGGTGESFTPLAHPRKRLGDS